LKKGAIHVPSPEERETARRLAARETGIMIFMSGRRRRGVLGKRGKRKRSRKGLLALPLAERS